MKRSPTEQFLELAEDRPFSEELLVEIRRQLAWELRRRGAGSRLSPSIFGCPDWDDWKDLFIRGAKEKILKSSGPLMDLALDCYEYAVIRRFDSLREHAKQKENIDGLIAVNIRNFVSERQRQADPCGTATYRNIKATVEELVQKAVLSTHGLRRGAIYNETLLFFGDEKTGRAADIEELNEWISSKGESFEIAAKLGATVSVEVQSGLGELIETELSKAVSEFYFRDLVGAWKRLARHAYEGIRYREDNELAVVSMGDEAHREATTQVRDEEQRFEIFEEFHDLDSDLNRLREAVKNSGQQKRVIRRMLKIVDALREELLAKEKDELPSQAELARRLEISTSTYSDYIIRLRAAMQELNSDI